VLTQVQFLWAPVSLIFDSAKNVQNLVRFKTIFELSANIFGNDEDSDKLQTALTRKIFSELNKENLCEIPSTTNKVLNVHADLL